MVKDWYQEHIPETLSAEGYGGPFLRYRNVDPAATPDFEMSENFMSRLNHDSTGDEVQKVSWPCLAIVIFADQAWCLSQAFEDIPRSSKKLNSDPNGAPASAFEVFYPALRTYVAVGGGVISGERWPSFFVGLQVSSTQEDVFEKLTSEAKKYPGFRGAVCYRLVEGYLAVTEPGKLPPGFMMYHFEGTAQPQGEFGRHSNVLKQNMWQLVVAEGDTTLGI